MNLPSEELLAMTQAQAKAKLLAQNKARASALLQNVLRDLEANSSKAEIKKVENYGS